MIVVVAMVVVNIVVQVVVIVAVVFCLSACLHIFVFVCSVCPINRMEKLKKKTVVNIANSIRGLKAEAVARCAVERHEGRMNPTELLLLLKASRNLCNLKKCTSYRDNFLNTMLNKLTADIF